MNLELLFSLNFCSLTQWQYIPWGLNSAYRPVIGLTRLKKIQNGGQHEKNYYRNFKYMPF